MDEIPAKAFPKLSKASPLSSFFSFSDSVFAFGSFLLSPPGGSLVSPAAIPVPVVGGVSAADVGRGLGVGTSGDNGVSAAAAPVLPPPIALCS